MQQATSTIPIVFAVVNDPISTGFAKSLARPGGNLTGLSRNTVDISPKHVELLRAIAPTLSQLAVLVNPGNPAHPIVLKAIQAAAQRVGIKVLPVEARTPEEIGRGFALMKQARAQAVVVGLDQFFIDHEQEIAQLALKNQLATIYSIRDESRLPAPSGAARCCVRRRPARRPAWGALRSGSPADGRAPPGALDGGRRGRDPGARPRGRGARGGSRERAFGVPSLSSRIE